MSGRSDPKVTSSRTIRTTLEPTQVTSVSPCRARAEALWKRAAWEMTSPLLRVSGLSPFASSWVPSPAMAGYAAIYLTAAVAFAAWSFARRDL